MIRVCVFLVSLFLSGCYIKSTSVISSYDLKPRKRVDRQPERVFQAFPHLLLNKDLLVRFINTPARKIKPSEENCKNSMDNTIDIFMYSSKPYSLSLDKSVVRANGKEYKIVKHKRYDKNVLSDVFSGDAISPVVTTHDLTQFSYAANSNLNRAYASYNVNNIEATFSLQFDEDFSCGETNFEFELLFKDENGVDEKYFVYFFPWVISVTPH